ATIRTATIRAHTDGTLFVLDRNDFKILCKHFPMVEKELQKATNTMITTSKRPSGGRRGATLGTRERAGGS
ncbi:hypothetical protein T484DRAFT_1872452, partial [Baffinella frigidus]